MKRFMAVFTGSPSAIESYAKRFPTEDARKASDRKGMDAWMAWAKKHEKSIVDGGAPLGRTRRVTKDGITDVRNNLAARSKSMGMRSSRGIAVMGSTQIIEVLRGGRPPRLVNPQVWPRFVERYAAAKGQ